MSKRIFTREQIKTLLDNPNVSKCSGKAIVYSKDFRIKAIKLYNEQGLGPQEIFRQAGFNLDIIGADKPKGCLKRWQKIYRTKGETGLKTESRGRNGGRPKTKYQTDQEKIKYLEAQVAYLKVENDFLAKLRAKRAE